MDQQPLTAPHLLRAQERLRARRRATLLLVVLASLAVRAVYFVQLDSGPCIEEHRWAQWDMEFFDRWARQIAAGDWLTSRPLHPFAFWHASVAASYFEREPQGELAKRFRAARTREEAEDVSKELWNRWYGGTQFHQEPLYPYLIALTYRVLGANVRWVFAWQLLLGVATNALIYLLARRFMGDLVAAVTALMAVACAPALYYELILLRTSAIAFATIAIVWSALRALDRGTPRAWFVAGTTFGLGVLLQSPLVVLPLAILGGAIAVKRKAPRAWVRSGATAALGLAVVIAPVVVRNVVVGAPPFGLSSVGAVTFVCANAADNQPDAGFFISRSTADIMGRSDGRLLPAVALTLGTHPDLASFARLMAGKLAALGHWYEIPNNTNFYFYRLHASVLRLLPVTWTLVGPLGLLGMGLALPSFRSRAWLYLPVAASAAPMLAFYVLSRFRAPVLVALLPFAAFAVVTLADWALRREWTKAGLAVVAGSVLYVWTARPLPAGRPLIRIQDHSVTYHIYYDPLATEAERRGDWKRAAGLLAEFLRLEPPEIRGSSAANPPNDPSLRSFAGRYGRIHLRYAQALDNAGAHDEASVERHRAAALLSLASAGAS